MQFLSPWYLLGALAVGVPILIHLIRRRKVTVVAWAAHRFLIAATRKLQKRRRIEDLILLLLRCLLFLLLALLFARPFFAGSDDVRVEEDSTLVLLVDASASMGYSDGVKTRFDRARDLSEEIMGKLPESTAVALVLFAEQAYPIVGSPTSERNLVRNELSRQRPRPGSSNLVAGLSAAMEILSSRGGGSIVVVTDGQATAWSQKAELNELAERAKAESITLELRLLESSGPVRNLGVIGFEPVVKRPVTGQAQRFRALVRNGGAEASPETRLLLEKEPGVPIEEARIPALDPGEAVTVMLETRFDRGGAHMLTARLTGDQFAADDSRTIALTVSDGMRVGIVEGRSSANRLVAPGFFLRTAAVPVAEDDEASFPVQVEHLMPEALVDAGGLEAYDVLVIAGLAGIDEVQADALRRYLSQGGALWINPPSDPEAAEQFAGNAGVRRLIGETRLSLGAAVSSAPASPPYAHPITGFWNDQAAGSLEGFFIDRYLRIELADTFDPVLALRNGDVLFAAGRYEQGRVFLSAIPLDGEWSEFPLAAQFVPVVQRVLSWLSGEAPAPLEVRPGEAWRMQVEPANVGRPFYVASPSQEGSPQAAGQVEFQEGRAWIAFSNTRSLGRYRLYLDTEAPPVGGFGANLPASETDLRTADASDLAMFGSDNLSVAEAGRGTGVFARLARSLPDLWIMLAVLLLAAALAESFLAHRFSRPR